jgi:CheY-like chemotaxis protein
MEILPERFALHDIVADVRSMMDIRANEKNIGLQVTFDGLVPAVITSDSRRIKQILINLIGNAIKFTESGGVQVSVRYQTGSTPEIRFEVVDTGIGISEEQLSRLFLPFSQGDASVTRSFGGTGLGLAISRRLATMLGGRIEVQSQVGRGSTFVFTISAGDVEGTEMIHPRFDSPAADDRSTIDQIKLDARVLVVDDRRDVRFLARHFLVKAGAAVEMADDGLAALRIIEQVVKGQGEAIDLVLLDMQMPRLDGYQTATQLRTLGFRGPIIALTADAMDGDRNRCLACGCDAYLSKPIDARQLLEVIHEHTSGRTER